jgi:hypothetical protein
LHQALSEEVVGDKKTRRQDVNKVGLLVQAAGTRDGGFVVCLIRSPKGNKAMSIPPVAAASDAPSGGGLVLMQAGSRLIRTASTNSIPAAISPNISDTMRTS